VAGKVHKLQTKAEYFDNFWDRVVFNKVRQLLGGRVRFMASGSAPMNPEVLKFFKVAFCSPIFEGYG